MDIQNKLLEIIDLAIKSREGNKLFIDFAKLNINEIKELNELTGIDFTGFVHTIDSAGIIHALKHENIKSSDILLIPFIIANYDIIGIGKVENTIVYKKLIGDVYFYVEEVRKGRKKLAIKTLYKRSLTKKRQKKI